MSRYHSLQVLPREDVRPVNKLGAKFQPALASLLVAYEYAEQTFVDRWEFAVEIKQLRKLGLSRNDLRLLVRMQLVKHAREVTVAEHDGRQYEPTGDLTFTKRTCFVLTPAGVTAARDMRAASFPRQLAMRVSAASAEVISKSSGPMWDAGERLLQFDGRIVKKFKWHAANQEAILAAFEEEGWPTKIDDPLTPQPEQDSKRRLSDTIKCLNRKQANRLLHFRGDGTGEGVLWEVIEREQSNLCDVCIS